MLRPIPSRILRSTAIVKVCTAIDMYQKQVYGKVYTVRRVHLQPTERIIKTATNTDQQLSSILFVDMRHSSPALNWRQLLQSAHDKGGDVRVIVRGVEYTMAAADLLRDDTDRPHHWEISMY
jgi:hypothetical protein